MEEERGSLETVSSGVDMPSGMSAEPTSQSEGMGDLLDAHGHEYRSLKRGDVIEGIVVRIDKDEVLVDIGSKSEGVIPFHEMRDAHGNPTETLHVGDEILAYVLQQENQDGHVVLSVNRAQAEKGWRVAQTRFERGEIIEAEIVEHNKGGLIANVEGVRGFIPLSQIVDLKSVSASEESVEERLKAMRGERKFLKVIEINRRRNRLILSERAAIQERRAVQKDRLLIELKEGEVRHGRVSSLCEFGAFIDLGGADGLVHLSELSWGQVSHPSQVLKVGQDVDTMVVGVDRDNKKIALSLKRLQPEPWSGVADRYQVGQIVKARITKLASFGAFAQIEDGLEGLIHISELSDDRIIHPKGVVKEGEEVLLRIIRIDASRHRLGLSLRQAKEEGYEEGTDVPVPASAVSEAPAEAPEPAPAASGSASKVSEPAPPEEAPEAPAPKEQEADGMAHKVPSATMREGEVESGIPHPVEVPSGTSTPLPKGEGEGALPRGEGTEGQRLDSERAPSTGASVSDGLAGQPVP